LLKGLGEELRQPDAVFVFAVFQDGCPSGFQVLVAKARHRRPLKVVGEADAEDPLFPLRHLRVGGRGADHRDASRLANVAPDDAAGTGDFPQDSDDAVTGDEFLDGGSGFLRLARIVLGDDDNLFAQHATLTVDFVHRQADAFVGGLTESCRRSCHGRKVPDLDDIGFRFPTSCQCQQKRRQKEAKQSHGASPRRGKDSQADASSSLACPLTRWAKGCEAATCAKIKA
jgi:hypothetical protein